MMSGSQVRVNTGKGGWWWWGNQTVKFLMDFSSPDEMIEKQFIQFHFSSDMVINKVVCTC